MAEAKHTSGPWVLVESDQWPFDLEIRGPDGREIVRFRRWAHTTDQKSLADCMAAKGFKADEKQAIIADLQRQVADARAMAAAPELYEALRDMTMMFNAVRECIPWGKTFLNGDAIRLMNDAPMAALKAMAKAEGRE